MKRREPLRHLERNTCRLFREGRRHAVYVNPVSRKTSTVPRHTAIQDVLAAKIRKDLGVPPPGRR